MLNIENEAKKIVKTVLGEMENEKRVYELRLQPEGVIIEFNPRIENIYTIALKELDKKLNVLKLKRCELYIISNKIMSNDKLDTQEKLKKINFACCKSLMNSFPFHSSVMRVETPAFQAGSFQLAVVLCCLGWTTEPARIQNTR